MIIEIEICDNGGWRPAIQAETVEGECLDCHKTGLVLRYLAPHLRDEVELCAPCFGKDEDLRALPSGLKAEVLRGRCNGPNENCRAAHRAGRSVHVIPGPHSAFHEALVMPTYHYATSADGIDAIYDALENAPMVDNDEDLKRYRTEKVAFRLPVGWVDPEFRR